MARTSNNRVILLGELYCCLLPQCKALRTCHSGFPIVTLVIYHSWLNVMYLFANSPHNSLRTYITAVGCCFLWCVKVDLKRASQPFWCRGPLFAETLILGPLHEKFVSKLITRHNHGDETILTLTSRTKNEATEVWKALRRVLTYVAHGHRTCLGFVEPTIAFQG